MPDMKFRLPRKKSECGNNFYGISGRTSGKVFVNVYISLDYGNRNDLVWINAIY